MKEIIIMNPRDNVGICLRDFRSGEKLDFQLDDKNLCVAFEDPVPMGHKVALSDIQKGDPIIKYGEKIGRATIDITVGQHVHLHNVTDWE